MIIEFEKLYNEYVVWRVEGSAKFEQFKAKTKKECKEYLKQIKIKSKKSK